MVPLTALWLPIVLAAVIVFFASSIMHMVLPYHRGDYKQLPDEEKILGVLRAAGLQRGLYVLPFATHKNMKSPEVQQKYQQGPVGMLTVAPNGPPCRSFWVSGLATASSSDSSSPTSQDTPSLPARNIPPCFTSRALPHS